MSGTSPAWHPRYWMGPAEQVEAARTTRADPQLYAMVPPLGEPARRLNASGSSAAVLIASTVDEPQPPDGPEEMDPAAGAALLGII